MYIVVFSIVIYFILTLPPQKTRVLLWIQQHQRVSKYLHMPLVFLDIPSKGCVQPACPLPQKIFLKLYNNIDTEQSTKK